MGNGSRLIWKMNAINFEGYFIFSVTFMTFLLILIIESFSSCLQLFYL